MRLTLTTFGILCKLSENNREVSNTMWMAVKHKRKYLTFIMSKRVQVSKSFKGKQVKLAMVENNTVHFYIPNSLWCAYRYFLYFVNIDHTECCHVAGFHQQLPNVSLAVASASWIHITLILFPLHIKVNQGCTSALRWTSASLVSILFAIPTLPHKELQPSFTNIHVH